MTLLFIYMGFLLCLDPLMNTRRAQTSYQPQLNEDINMVICLFNWNLFFSMNPSLLNWNIIFILNSLQILEAFYWRKAKPLIVFLMNFFQTSYFKRSANSIPNQKLWLVAQSIFNIFKCKSYLFKCCTFFRLMLSYSFLMTRYFH